MIDLSHHHSLVYLELQGSIFHCTAITDTALVDISGSVQGLIDWFNTLVCFLVDDVLDIKRRLSNIGKALATTFPLSPPA